MHFNAAHQLVEDRQQWNLFIMGHCCNGPLLSTCDNDAYNNHYYSSALTLFTVQQEWNPRKNNSASTILEANFFGKLCEA